MNALTCPKCQGEMRQYERSGVTVDQCSECRGIFLDRGELDKLVNAENSWHQGPSDRGREQRHYEERRPEPRYEERRYSDDDYSRRRKKKSFLDELFD